MGEFSIWHWMVVLLVVLLLFGGGKVSGLMGDLAKGIKSFKANMADDPVPTKTAALDRPAETISTPVAETVTRPVPVVRETEVVRRETTLAQ